MKVGSNDSSALEVKAVSDPLPSLGLRPRAYAIRLALFAKVGELPLGNGLKLCGDTIVDATIIAAAGSTKNERKHVIPRCTRPSRETRGISA